jgi:OmpA-OmpF porin, OOP family
MTHAPRTADADPSDRSSFSSRINAFAMRWLLPALVVTSLITIAALVTQYSGIEDDLRGRVAIRMQQIGQDWATVEIAGRDVVLAGTAPSVERQQVALDAAAAIWGVAAVRDRTELIPLIEPFDWTAERDGAFIILTGYVPSDEARRTVRGLVTAILPQAVVDDRTELARGAPTEFQSGVEFALRILANVTTGRVGLSGLEVSAEGLALDTPRYQNTVEILRAALPSTMSLTNSAIEPPLVVPYLLSVTISDAVAVISGSTPNAGVADRLAAATISAFGSLVVENRTELGSGAPANFELMANRVLQMSSLLASGEVELTDSSLSIAGRARSPEAYEDLLGLLRDEQPGGMRIAFQDVAPSVAEAFVLEVVRSGTGVELIGFMPSDAARAEILTEAYRLFGEVRTSDRLQIADGAPRMDWIGAAKFALAQVAELSGGSARISDHSYSITGTAATSESYEALREALAGTLPASLVLNNALVTAPVESPYRFTAAVGPETVTLSGAVPSPELRGFFGEQAELRFATLPVTNEMRLASGAPVGFEEVVLAGLQAISRLDAGRLEVVDLAVSVTGVAPYQGAITRIEEQLRDALPAEFTITTTLTPTPVQGPVPPATCQELLVDELGEGGIKFDEGTTAIAAESEGRLDRLVAILQRCADAKVEIGGHTDSFGTTARNQELSRIRAQAVVDYLEQAGIPADRLSAVGYGEANPIASNETEEGRAQNRRIEFRIVEP